jgi:beta-galactosidase
VASGDQVETVRRGGLLFVINHGEHAAELSVSGTDVLTGAPAAGMRLFPQGVAIVDTGTAEPGPAAQAGGQG